MQCLLLSLALLTTGHALKCVTDGPKGKLRGPDLAPKVFAEACYAPANKDGEGSGFVPAEYVGSIDMSKAGCNEDGCWCMTDNCNTREWVSKFHEEWSNRPRCWTGVTGSNPGPSCDRTQLFLANEYKTRNCHGRTISKRCLENNKGMGMGDGCDTKTTQSACEAAGDGKLRDPKDSFDGTTKHCRWAPELTKATKKTSCEADEFCTFYSDRGAVVNGSHEGDCENSAAANTNQSKWFTQRGQDCGNRMKAGCFDTNQHMGAADRCTKYKDSTTCHWGGYRPEGFCSGTASSGKACNLRTSKGECSSPGAAGQCSWKFQSCQWRPEPRDLADACANNGKGTMDGMCAYNDGVGPTSAETVKAGFEYGLFNKKDRFEGHCSLVASFRNGKGSAAALGGNEIGSVRNACKNTATWKALAEHIGHTSQSIDEYCANFMPDTSAMAALNKYSPAFIIKKVEQGQFDAVFPGLVGQMPIVTANPEIGKCLFTAVQGTFGAAVCACDKKECNGQASLELIVDRTKGPMRLLQFIDGSLSPFKDKINAIVHDLVDAKGRMNPASVGRVTLAQVHEVMRIPGVSDKTTKAEFWGATQDMVKLLKAQSDYKASLNKDAKIKAVKIDASKVAAANKAAGTQLYGNDGLPNTVAFESMSDAKLRDVAGATGLAESKLAAGRTVAWYKEKGLEAPRSPVTSSGDVELMMSKAHATELAKRPEVLAIAIAKTVNVPATAVTIKGIYVDGAKVGPARRLGDSKADSKVRIDFEVKAAEVVKPVAMDGTTLKKNVEKEAEVVGVSVKITALPTVTVAELEAASGAATIWCRASLFAVGILLGLAADVL